MSRPLTTAVTTAARLALAGLAFVVLFVTLGGAAGCRTTPPVELPDAPAQTSRTALGPGDQISVKVFDEERFDRDLEVEEDGTVDVPFVGKVEVLGLMPSEAAQQIENRLSDGFLNDPHVTVVVKARSNREVSVLGQVNEPGSFEWQERLTLVQAVSLAGGLTPFAAPRRVKITRNVGKGDETRTIELSLSSIVDGKADDILLQPGDIVFVPESRI